MDVAGAIREWRRALGLTQYELGEKTGIHRAQIGAWEAGRHSPTVDSLEKLADFFRVDIVRLLTGPSRLPSSLPHTRADFNYPGMVAIPLYYPRAGVGVAPEGSPDGTFLVPAELDGFLALQLLADGAGVGVVADMARPEARVGDVWAGQFCGKGRDGVLTVALREIGGAVSHAAGVLDNRRRTLTPPNPMYPSVNLEDGWRITFCFGVLLWRDLREGVTR
jgi:transcriptional regulator with XRE-family HTH domain